MGKLIGILVSLTLLLPNLTYAQEKGIGFGVILGEPTGVSFKGWTGYKTAIDGAAAWSFGNESSWHFHADYLFHNRNFLKTKKGNLLVYYGIGGRIKGEKKSRVGLRFPIGFSYLFEKAPFDIFFELGPLLDLVPSTEFGITGGIGIRYYFE
ncbi:MAG: hypothetical protein IBX60_02745 [Candidatus Aminicenantes bacterium]|nr:hypothetical protein [Candidatus Aminicenantes bacterium]